MIGKVWIVMVFCSCVLSVCTGRGANVMEALNAGGKQAVELMLELMGAMVLWSGLMEQLEESGDMARVGRGLQRFAGRIFPGVGDTQTWAAVGMNVSANFFGLGNAATPAGIRAAQLLSRQGENGLRVLSMLLVVNNSGLQLIPTTVIALRSAAGAANPADIWMPTLLSSGAATITAVLLMLVLIRRGENAGEYHAGACGNGDPAGRPGGRVRRIPAGSKKRHAGGA